MLAGQTMNATTSLVSHFKYAVIARADTRAHMQGYGSRPALGCKAEKKFADGPRRRVERSVVRPNRPPGPPHIALVPPARSDYTQGMNAVFPILIAVALLATLAVLLTGVVSMVKGGDFNRRHGNRLMRWRVALQGSAVLLILIALLLGRG